MNFSAWALKRPVPVMVLFFILMVGGWMGFRSMTVQNLPDFDLPVVTVTALMPGATASNMETEVAKKLEDAFVGIDKLEHITTTVTEGTAAISLQFELEKPAQEAVDDVKDAISQVKADLPAQVEEPIVKKLNITGSALISYGVSSPTMDTKQLSWFVDNELTKALMKVSGVGEVSRKGGVEREIVVTLDKTKMASYGVTAADISSQLRQRTQDAAGGRTTLAGHEQAVRAAGTLADISALHEYPLSLGGAGGHVRLSDIAKIEDGTQEQRTLAMVDGKEVVSFQVFRSKGTSEVDVGDAVRAAVAELAAQRSDIQFKELFNDIEKVRAQYDASMKALYEGAILAVVVVMLFLRNARATFVSGMALPLSVIPTFMAMAMFGFSLNTVTLLALTLVVGILVDDAIVEVECVVRHQQMGKKPYEAARDAAAEIGLAVIATSMTLVAVFLPTAFMAGIPGKFFKQFGWTAALAVLMSLLVARLVTPVMASKLMKPMKEHPVEDAAWHKRYMSWLTFTLTRPGTVLLMAGAFFVGSVYLMGKLPAGFVPKGSSGQLSVSVELAPGATIHDTVEVLEKARSKVADLEGIQRVYVIAGTGDVRNGSLTLTLSGEVKNETELESVVRKRLADVPGAKFSYGKGGSGEKLEIVLTGDNLQTLSESARKVEQGLRTIHGFGNVNSSLSKLKPELLVTLDLEKAAAYGVSVQQVGQAVKVATVGDADKALPKLNQGERQLGVRVKLDDTERTSMEAIEQLRVPTSRGDYVMLAEVARVELTSGPAEITRYDRSRSVTITAELAGMQMGEAVSKVNALPALLELPEDVKRKAAGDMERMMELFTSFGLAMALGVLAVYLVLVLLFHDFVQPLTILTALPLSVGGAVLALMAGGYSLSMPALIGLLMLMGIVTKNSILLVEYATRIQRSMGWGGVDAIREACSKRVRPILMTTIAMGAGMLPIALATSGDSSFRAPMAAAVLGGLMTSTLLSLFVVPAVFILVDRLERRVYRRKRKNLKKRALARRVA